MKGVLPAFAAVESCCSIRRAPKLGAPHTGRPATIDRRCWVMAVPPSPTSSGYIWWAAGRGQRLPYSWLCTPTRQQLAQVYKQLTSCAGKQGVATAANPRRAVGRWAVCQPICCPYTADIVVKAASRWLAAQNGHVQSQPQAKRAHHETCAWTCTSPAFRARRTVMSRISATLPRDLQTNSSLRTGLSERRLSLCTN